jgi:pimeloyl-ACP methyl ester carboxylesterase
MRSGQCLPINTDWRLDRLALLAPATGFFQCRGALDAVTTPIRAWVGTNDAISPPAHANYLKETLGARVSVEVNIVDGAGHFSFMNEPPPLMTDPLPNRDAFLASLAAVVCGFVTA